MAGVCEVDGFPCTEQGIRDAIAAGGGPHTFACVGPTTVATASEISINNDVILDGRGLLTVDGQNDHRVFLVLHPGITAELRGMTITRGGGDVDYGAGIRNNGALTLSDVAVRDCTATGHGGALYQSGPSMDLTRVTLTGNNAYAAGAIGGGQGPITITDSVLSNNTATVLGGAIYVGGITTIDGSTLSNNETLFGGAIIVIHQGELALYDSTISGNRAEEGGGIYTHGTVTIDNSVVSDNEVTGGGGGIRQDEGIVAINNSTISGNTAQFGAGLEAATVAPDTSLLTTLNTTVSGNAAVSVGGGVVAFGTSTLEFVHSTVAGNTAGNEGSAGYATDTVTVTYRGNIIEGTCVAGSTTVNGASYGYNIESPGNTCIPAVSTDVTNVSPAALGLGPLQDNGGPTLTQAPESSGSIAVDLVPAAACTDHSGAPLVLDQRGLNRPENANCDAGAVEGYCENCDDGNVCTTGACDPVTRTCNYTQLPDWTPCPSGTGLCVGGVCHLCAGVTCPDDGNECTDDVCDPATGSCSVPVLDGTACDAGNGQCVAGVCEPTDTPESQGFDSDALASFIQGIEGMGVDSLLVIRNGVMILDAYFYPYLGDRPHDVASVTKTVTSTLTGIAIDQGFLQGVDQQVMPVFAADYPDIPAVGGKEDITFEHLLTLTSGLDCGASDGASLLQMLSSADWVRHVLERDMISPPGTTYVYCSPAVHLLAAALIKPSGQNALEFAEQYLFSPLGIDDTDWHWPLDPQGIVHGWGDLQLHPHAMARFGQMFLNQGMWDQTQVVSSQWVERATQPQPWRYLWWQPPFFENAYAAAGRGGQHIIVQPDRNLVVVATGSLDIDLWWAPDFLDTLVSDVALPPNPDAYQRLMTAINEATMPPAPLDPVPTLPPTAMDVSGRVYALDANQFGVRCYAVHFDSANPSEATVDLTMQGQDGTFEEFSLPVGMDGVPRFSDIEPRGFQVGMVGEWATPNRFDLLYDDLGGVNHLSVLSSFGASATDVAIDFIDRTGYFATQSVSGYWVDTGICPY